MSDDVLELDDVASRALAVIILESVADTIGNRGETAAIVLCALADDTGLSLDVSAAILTACTALCVAGDIDAVTITGCAMALDPGDDDTPGGAVDGSTNT